MLEKYSITFESHSVFLDSSNTPLPLAFETFPLSGSILHVRGEKYCTIRGVLLILETFSFSAKLCWLLSSKGCGVRNLKTHTPGQ